MATIASLDNLTSIEGIEIEVSTALEESASKSPLSLSTGCLWYKTDPVKDASIVVADLATIKDTSFPDTVVHSGLAVTSTEAENNLNALTPLRSAFNPLNDLVIL